MLDILIPAQKASWDIFRGKTSQVHPMHPWFKIREKQHLGIPNETGLGLQLMTFHKITSM